MSLSSVRFQEVHALLSCLIFQNEPQKPVLVTRKGIRQFVILPVSLLRELQKLLLPYEKHDNLQNIWLIGITKFRKGILSFERACEMFKQGEQCWADALLILVHDEPAGAMFRYERYEALLTFLRSKGVVLPDTFTCDEKQSDEPLRMLPMAAAIQRFSGLPAQFADEETTSGSSLPVVVSHNQTPVLAVFPWTLCQLIMQEIVSREVSLALQKLVVWWLSSYANGAATFQAGLQISPVYTLLHPDGSEIPVHSLDEFNRLALDVLIYRLAYGHAQDIENIDSESNFTLETVDLLVPEPEAGEKLLTFVLWNSDFFTDALEYYAEDNCLDAAHLVYEHVYQHVRSLFENQWEDVKAQAKSIREEGSSDPGVTQVVEE